MLQVKFLTVVFLMILSVKCNYNKDLKQYLKDCSEKISQEAKIHQKLVCKSLETSYILWLINTKSNSHGIHCLFWNLKENKLSKDQQSHHWILLSKLLQSKTCSKKALKFVKSTADKIKLSDKWSFLGPFQIGKQEVDASPFLTEEILFIPAI